MLSLRRRHIGWLLLWCLQVSALERPRCQTDSCIEKSSTVDEFFYTINGTKLIIKFDEGTFYMSTCGPPLEHPAQPRFPRPAAFAKVILVGCAPPADLAAALAALGLRPAAVRALELRALPAAPAPAALLALPALHTLELSAAARLERSVSVERGALPPQLRRLCLRRVRPPPELPRELRRLELFGTGVAALPLAGLERLEFLAVEEDALLAEGAAGLAALTALRSLTLNAPLPALPALPPRLEQALVARVSLAGLRAWPACGRLAELTLDDNGLGALGAGWLAGCGALRRLRLLRQGALSPSPLALRGAPQLRELQVLHCAALRLPPDLLHHTPLLVNLSLASNHIDDLPDGLLAPVATSLERLDLAHNRLDARCLRQLPATLSELQLADNPLGELCVPYARSSSALARLLRLRELGLSGVNASHLCADWLRLPRLERLDLTHNLFTDLQLSDVVVTAAGGELTLDLSYNPLVRISADRDDYERARTRPDARKVQLLLTDALRCDCHMYWAAAALRPGARVVLAARCRPAPAPRAAHLLRPPERLLHPPPYAPPNAARRPPPARLAARAPEDFTCEVKEDLCADECDCVAWPPLGVVAACTGSRLPAVPGLVAASVARLPDTLPPELALIDVRSANVSIQSGQELRRLAGGGRGVLLAGAALRCDCGVRAAAAQLRALLLDLPAARCLGGRALPGALDDCGASAWPWPLAAAAAAAVAVVVVVVAAAALRPHGLLRRRVKAALHRRWRHRWVEGGGEARLFDVFVWHCAADERWVCGVLLPALEARGLRVCVRARDWPPGAWLPRQLRLSVCAARAVLLVLSRAAASCRWARYELDVVSASGARVVLLRRDDSVAPRVAALADLAADHPRLWDKLLRLIPPRPPLAA